MLRCITTPLIFCPYVGDGKFEYHLTIMKGDDEMIKGSVPVRIAAKVYGKNSQWIREGIVSGYLPIGIATRNGKQLTDISELDCKYGRANFYISPKKLYQETGYLWRGEK